MHANEVAIDKLRGEERVQVKRRNIYMFMFRDGTHWNTRSTPLPSPNSRLVTGTLITFHDGLDTIHDQAIRTRIQDENTMLRGTAGSSYWTFASHLTWIDASVLCVRCFRSPSKFA